MQLAILLFALVCSTAQAEKPDPVPVWKNGEQVDCDHIGPDIKEKPYNGLDDDCDTHTPDDDLDNDGRRWFEDCDDTIAEEQPPRRIEGTFRWPTEKTPCNKGGPPVVVDALYIEKNAKGLKKLHCICAVVGDLQMRDNANVKTMHGLENLKAIGGNATFVGNRALTSFGGLTSLGQVGGDLAIIDNDEVPNLAEGFERLTQVTGGFTVGGNDAMIDLDGLNELIGVGGDFQISDQDKMMAISGLIAMATIGGDFKVDNNAVLATIQGLTAVAMIGGQFEVEDNPKLENQDEIMAMLLGAVLGKDNDAPQESIFKLEMTPTLGAALGGLFCAGLFGLVLITPLMNKVFLYLFDEPKKEQRARSNEDDYAHISFKEQEEWVRHVPRPLDNVSAADMMIANMHLHELIIDVGQVLIHEDDTDPAVAWIVEGELEVSVKGVEVGIAHADEVVGEMALFGDTVRGAEVRAAMSTRVLVLERNGYEALVSINHPVARILEETCIKCMGTRLEDTGKRLAKKSLGTRNRINDASPEQVAQALQIWGHTFTPKAAEDEPDPMGLLAKTTTFGHFSPEQLAEFAEYVTIKKHRAGDPIFVQGDPADEILILASGRADLLLTTHESDEAILLDDLFPGDVFGMTSMISHTPRMASCMCLSPVTTLALEGPHIQTLTTSDTLLARAFRIAMIKACAATLREANTNIASRGQGRQAIAQNLLQAHLALLRQR